MNKHVNKGREKATAAALAVGGKVCFPSFKSDDGKPTDFNDLHSSEGLDIVRAQIMTAAVPRDSKQRGFRLESIGAFLSQIIAADWLIKGWLEANTLSCIYGPTETLKSFVALDMLLSIATGLSWCGCEIKKSGPVVYICGEGRSGISRRVKAWMISHNVTEPPQFFISNGAAELLDKGNVEQIKKEIQTISGKYGMPVAIGIDTLNRNMGAGDENSTTDMTAVVAAQDELKNFTGAAIITVHHTGVMTTSRARGSSALKAALDFEFQTQLENRDEHLVKLSCTKCKDHEAPKPMMLKGEVIGLGKVDEDLNELTSLVMVPTDAPAKADRPKLPPAAQKALEGLTWMESEKKGPVHIDEWREEAYKRGITDSGTPDARRKAFKRAWGRLMDDELISCKNDFYSLKKDEFILPDNRTDPDKAGHVRDVSGGVDRTDTDTPLKRCPVSGPGVRSGGDFEEKEKNSFLHEKKDSGGGADPHSSDPVLPGLVANAGWSED